MGELADKWRPTFESSPQALLETAFRQLTDMEVDLEQRLRDIQDVKAALLIQIELKVNGKKRN